MNHDRRNIPSKLLLVRTDRIGDVILSTPVASALKRHFPQIEIHFVVRRYSLPVVVDHIHVHQAWVEENFHSFRSKVNFLKTNRFTSIIFLHPEPYWAFAAFISGIPIRIGTGYRAYSFLFNRKIYEHRKYGTRHEVNLNLDLLRPLGIHDASVSFDVSIPPEAEESVKKMVTTEKLKQPFIVIHPGSGGSALDWPSMHFSELSDQIVKKLKISVIFTGTSNESSLIDDILQRATITHSRFDGLLDLKQLAALLRRAVLVVANSTGPLHLAVAVGSRVIGLYCPERACHPDRWGPFGQRESVIMPPMERCDRCKKKRCKHYNCMELISVDQVFKKVEEALEAVK